MKGQLLFSNCLEIVILFLIMPWTINCIQSHSINFVLSGVDFRLVSEVVLTAGGLLTSPSLVLWRSS